MVGNFLQKPGIDAPFISRARPVEDGMLSGSWFISELVSSNDAQSTDHSNNEPTFCRVRIFVEFELAAFDRCVLISSSGPPFEDEQQSFEINLAAESV